MGIEVSIERGDGVLVREVWGDPLNRFARLVHRAWELGIDQFPFLTSIDPYGDTRFNYLMAERFGHELVRISGHVNNEAELIANLTTACSEVAGGQVPGLHLVFLGD